MASVLVTGGAGYLGSHTCVELLSAGHDVVVFDNLSNSCEEALNRVQELTHKSLTFVQGDIRYQDEIDQVFSDHHIDVVIHFAGLKAINESLETPLTYFDHNVVGGTQLLKSMEKAKVFTLIFSSSATIYEAIGDIPLHEDVPVLSKNNYSYTKLITEQMLQQIAKADSRWSIALLRYFNPVGAHKSGRIGEDPQGVPNNLMPYITQVAVGRRKKLSIYGHDYDTIDGTGVRDYIHVVDLARAHLCALNNRLETKGCRAWNIGTGRGSSVLQVKNSFEEVTGISIAFELSSRRAGDVATSCADNSRAVTELGWQPQYTLKDMLIDSWNWQKQNPNGYN